MTRRCGVRKALGKECGPAQGAGQGRDGPLSIGTPANNERACLGRKPSYTREQFNTMRDMLGQEAVRHGDVIENPNPVFVLSETQADVHARIPLRDTTSGRTSD